MNLPSLFLCLSALCMISAAGDDRDYHPHFQSDYPLVHPHLQNDYPPLQNEEIHYQRQSGPHRIQKRQADFYLDECENVIHYDFCTNGLYQDYSDVSQMCSSYAYFDTEIYTICILNSTGGSCVYHRIYTIKYNIERECDSPCSPECRELLVSARSELGCCIASIFNDSSVSSYYEPAIFSYTLWSSCRVEPVTQRCPPSTIMLTPVKVDPTCNTRAVAEQQLFSTVCKRNYRDSVMSSLSATEGCQNYSTYTTKFSFCASNQFGIYCAATEYSPELLSDNCNDTSMCDPFCIETLSHITDTIGCCVNYWYNRSYSEDWMSHEFWTMCSLESPGFCEIGLIEEGRQKTS